MLCVMHNTIYVSMAPRQNVRLNCSRYMQTTQLEFNQVLLTTQLKVAHMYIQYRKSSWSCSDQ